MRAWLRVYYCVFGALLLAACASVSVTAVHNPLYRASQHTSTITATATVRDGSIQTIEITAIVGELTACTEQDPRFPSLIPCRRNATQTTQTCAATSTCAMALNLGDRSLVTYTATARTTSGRSSTTQPITYAGGAPLTSYALDDNTTLPFETARPIWWHTGQPNSYTSAYHIDVGFFPDADYAGNYAQFAMDTGIIIRGAHFSMTTNFSKLYTVQRGSFNFWAGPLGADADGAAGAGQTQSFGGLSGAVASATDAEVTVHTISFGDWAFGSFTGSGTVTSTESDPWFVYVHESGHFLHNMGDEYCCGGGYSSGATPPNVHPSKEACESVAAAHNLIAANCVAIMNATTNTGFWRIDDGGQEIMDDRDPASEFRDAAALATGARFRMCSQALC